MQISDEAYFWLNGFVNKQNCRIWAESNPPQIQQLLMHPKKLTVWWSDGIIGPLMQEPELLSMEFVAEQ